VLLVISVLSSEVVPQDITFYIKLPIAGSYLFRQGLFYPVLYFIGTGSLALLVLVLRIPENK